MWPADNTNTAVKQRGRFVSSRRWNAPRRDTKMALLDDILRRHFRAAMKEIGPNASDDFHRGFSAVKWE